MKAIHEEHDVDVVLAGLGPTGLTLAHLLGKRGLRVVALEREPTFYGNARAVYTDDECMRIFQAAGVVDEVAADMMQDTPAQWVLKDGSVLGQFVTTKKPYGWGISNFLYQPYLETKLEELLSRYPNVTVLRGRELTSFTQDEVSVAILHRESADSGCNGRTTDAIEHLRDVRKLNARYLVGCDGGRSVVRSQLGIKMSGTSFPNPWLVVDLRFKNNENCTRHIPYFNFVLDSDCPTISCPQPDGHHRFEFMLMPGQSKEDMEDPTAIRQLLSRHIDVDRVEILRNLVYTFNALVADQWRNGRVLLAGDAAHMTPQFMGQGMSSGIRDAANLSWKLEAVLREKASDTLLDSYESERKPHAKQMIDVSVCMKDIVSEANSYRAWLRNIIIRTTLALPFTRDYVREARFKPTPTYQPGSYLGLPRRRNGPEGRLIAQPLVRSFDGQRALLDDVMGHGWAILGHGIDPTTCLSAALRIELEDLGTRFVTVYGLGSRPQGSQVSPVGTTGLLEIEDIDGGLLTWLREHGVRAGYVGLIRPDKFVYGFVPASEIAPMVDHLITQLQRPIPACKARYDKQHATLAS